PSQTKKIVLWCSGIKTCQFGIQQPGRIFCQISCFHYVSQNIIKPRIFFRCFFYPRERGHKRSYTRSDHGEVLLELGRHTQKRVPCLLTAVFKFRYPSVQHLHFIRISFTVSVIRGLPPELSCAAKGLL